MMLMDSFELEKVFVAATKLLAANDSSTDSRKTGNRPCKTEATA